MHTMMQVCREPDMTCQTLKFYCNEGLIPHGERDGSNRRVSDERDVKRTPDQPENCRLSIQEMKEYLALCLAGASAMIPRKEMSAKSRTRCGLR